VATIKSLDDVLGSGDGDIARLGESIRGRLDRASAYSEMYATQLDSQMDEALGRAELDLQLEERKRRLGLAEPSTYKADEEESAAAGDASS
jgi:phage shock protein A